MFFLEKFQISFQSYYVHGYIRTWLYPLELNSLIYAEMPSNILISWIIW